MIKEPTEKELQELLKGFSAEYNKLFNAHEFMNKKMPKVFIRKYEIITWLVNEHLKYINSE